MPDMSARGLCGPRLAKHSDQKPPRADAISSLARSSLPLSPSLTVRPSPVALGLTRSCNATILEQEGLDVASARHASTISEAQHVHFTRWRRTIEQPDRRVEIVPLMFFEFGEDSTGQFDSDAHPDALARTLASKAV